MKKHIKLSVALCALLVPGMVMAVNQTWVNWENDQDWSNAGNWNGGAVPAGAADEAYFNVAGLPAAIVSAPGTTVGRVVMDNGGMFAVASGGNLNNTGQHLSGFSALVDNTTVSGAYSVGAEFAIGQTGASSMTVNSGGSVTANGPWLIAGWQGGSTGAITVNGGTVTASTLGVGWDGAGTLTLNSGAVNATAVMNVAVGAAATGLVEVNGGVLTVAGLNAGASTGSATIDLTGGQIINNGGFVQNANAVFNIGAGEFVFATATVADVNWAIDNGGGTWNFAGDNGNVRSVTDNGSGGVVVTAIPEPATMGLMALVGGALLGFRRMFA